MPEILRIAIDRIIAGIAGLPGEQLRRTDQESHPEKFGNGEVLGAVVLRKHGLSLPRRGRGMKATSATLARPLGDCPREPRLRHRQAQAPLALIPRHEAEAQIECSRLITELAGGIRSIRRG